MRVKTTELTGAALDWAVAKCEGFEYEVSSGLLVKDEEPHFFRPYSTEWKYSGPIIERERTAICPDSNWELRGGRWSAVDWGGNIVEFGSTPLVAAMRCYVASKLGDEVDVPEELLP